MNILEIIISSFALASDAFAVSISKGISICNIKLKHCFKVALWFGFFQFLMSLIGYLFGIYFENIIVNIDHFVSFSLLCYIGIKMIKESFKSDECINNSLSFCEMFMFAIATSIDALSFGIAYSFGYKDVNYFLCFSLIGIITFILSFIGVKLGSKFGSKFESVAKMIGGIILILLGFNVLLDHLL